MAREEYTTRPSVFPQVYRHDTYRKKQTKEKRSATETAVEKVRDEDEGKDKEHGEATAQNRREDEYFYAKGMDTQEKPGMISFEGNEGKLEARSLYKAS